MRTIHPRLSNSFRYLLNKLVCKDCEESIPADQTEYKYDGGFLCESCRDGYYYACESCETLDHIDNSYSHNDYYYCRDCFNEYYSYCQRCDNSYSSDYGMWLERYDTNYCDNCLGEVTTLCDLCDERYENDDANNPMTQEGDCWYCPACKDDAPKTAKHGHPRLIKK